MPKSKTPILENEDVKELLALLKKNQTQNGKALTTAVKQVAGLEKQLTAAMDELKTMQQDLEQMRNHPLKTALQKSVLSLQDRILALRDNIAELKANIVEGCKQALADFKLRGVAALDSVGQFFRIKPLLEAVRNNLNQGIVIDKKAIARIENMSTEYHKAGRAVKNIGLTFMGKESVQEAKLPGRLSKVIATPYQMELSRLQAMKDNVEKAIGGMARLEQAAQKRPLSIVKSLQEHKGKIPPQAKKAREATREER